MPRPAPAAPRLPDAFTPGVRRTLVRADPPLGALMKRVGPFRLELSPLHSPFAALAPWRTVASRYLWRATELPWPGTAAEG
ncbi:hypothetical protein [Pyxidicoccus xibeiensis]|uniref:hypothetical protein n=1 Tax=Pyxidicoccus xibeiensis TaxID=2906759 RepID=UPI002B219306|nr:hypothetical protein [Pyxidicoccus xibeiensis]